MLATGGPRSAQAARGCLRCRHAGAAPCGNVSTGVIHPRCRAREHPLQESQRQPQQLASPADRAQDSGTRRGMAAGPGDRSSSDGRRRRGGRACAPWGAFIDGLVCRPACCSHPDALWLIDVSVAGVSTCRLPCAASDEGRSALLLRATRPRAGGAGAACRGNPGKLAPPSCGLLESSRAPVDCAELKPFGKRQLARGLDSSRDPKPPPAPTASPIATMHIVVVEEPADDVSSAAEPQPVLSCSPRLPWRLGLSLAGRAMAALLLRQRQLPKRTAAPPPHLPPAPPPTSAPLDRCSCCRRPSGAATCPACPTCC